MSLAEENCVTLRAPEKVSKWTLSGGSFVSRACVVICCGLSLSSLIAAKWVLLNSSVLFYLLL